MVTQRSTCQAVTTSLQCTASSSHQLTRRVTGGLVCITSITWPTTSVLLHCLTVQSCSVRASTNLLSVFRPHRKRGARTGRQPMASLSCSGRKMELSTRSLMACVLRTTIKAPVTRSRNAEYWFCSIVPCISTSNGLSWHYFCSAL